MKMINTLSLTNFRSWKEGQVEFHPGVSIITGENDSGKTNLLRAINWVVNNRPTGEELKSNWGGNTDVQLDIVNKIVGRHRTDKDNLYTLTHADGKKDEFRAFGTKVPEIIQQHLNFSPVNINFQMDGPFLLGKSPADVARYYNDAVNLDIIDRTISNIASTLREEKGRFKIQIEQQEKLTEQLKEFDWLDNAESELIRLEKMQALIIRKENEFSELSTMIQNLKSMDEEIEKIQEVTQHENKVLELLKKADKIFVLQTEKRELERFVSILKSLDEQEKEFQAVIKFEKQVDSLLELDKQIEAKTSQYNELFELMTSLVSLDKEIDLITKELARLESEFKTLMPDVCPILDVGCDKLKERKK